MAWTEFRISCKLIPLQTGDHNRTSSSELIDRVIGQLDKLDPDTAMHDGAPVDWVDLTWMQCTRRALRATSRGGRDLRILLRLGQTLRHGDILWRSTTNNGTNSGTSRQLIAINVLPTDVIIGRASDAKELALLAFELGNLHVPIELDGDQLISPRDGPVLEVFEKIGIDFQTANRRFTPTAIGIPRVSLSNEFRIERK